MGAHWIGSVAFEFRASGREALEPVRALLRDDFDALLKTPLERALTDANADERLVRRRRVEIDLGRLRPEEIEPEVLARRMAQELARQIFLPVSSSEAAGHRTVDEVEQLLLFLETGLLAWPSAGEALSEICAALLAQGYQRAELFAGKARALFARSPAAASRFVRQCPRELVRHVMLALGAGEPSPTIGGGVGYATEREAARLAGSIVRLARREIAKAGSGPWPERPAGGEPGRMGPAATGPEDGGGLGSSRQIRGGKADRDSAGKDLRLKSLPLKAAGTVLLHPFLASLFKNAGLLDVEGAFENRDTQARAILLLHFTGTGQTEAPEPELALAKLLCGLDLEMPVPRQIHLSCAERQAVENLLGEIPLLWTALGDCSPEALRETFLMRPGRLKPGRADWRLEVERTGVDVLLDRLPWGLGVVKTPFMARPLWVDWR